MMQTALLGAVIALARRPVYGSFAGDPPWGLTPFADQQLAGLLMWAPGCFVYVGVALALAARLCRPARQPGAPRG